MKTFWITWQSSPTTAEACVMDSCCMAHAVGEAIDNDLMPLACALRESYRVFELKSGAAIDLPRGRLLTYAEKMANGILSSTDPILN